MKENCLLFLDEKVTAVQMLLTADRISLSETKVAGLRMLSCHFVSSGPLYFCVKAPYRTEKKPDGSLTLWIPHAAVKLVVMTDQKDFVGFQQT